VSWPVESAQLSEDGQTKTLGYELATIDFFLGPHHTNDPSLALRGEVALWSQPGNPSQLVNVRPGEWIELKFRARVVCLLNDSDACVLRRHRDKLQISAWWYQRLLTTTMQKDCIFRSGAFTQNTIDSDPVEVVSGVPQPAPPTSLSPP
jgi:hypothetical protein